MPGCDFVIAGVASLTGFIGNGNQLLDPSLPLEFAFPLKSKKFAISITIQNRNNLFYHL
jgi:hypothetical protein